MNENSAQKKKLHEMTDEELIHNLDEMYERTKEIAKQYDYGKLPKNS